MADYCGPSLEWNVGDMLNVSVNSLFLRKSTVCVRQCHRSVFFAVWIFARENIHCLAIWHLLLCHVNFCRREYLLFGSLASASLPCEFLPERVYNYCLAVVSISLPCKCLPERVSAVWQWYLFLCHVNFCQREYFTIWQWMLLCHVNIYRRIFIIQLQVLYTCRLTHSVLGVGQCYYNL